MKHGRILCVTLLIALASGCAGTTKVAGRKHPVSLSSCQPAVPYVVSLEDWKAQQNLLREAGKDASDAALMADEVFLAPYRVQGGHLTPVEVRYPAHPYIAVFKRDGESPLMEGPFTPPAKVEVCFPGCEARVSAADVSGALQSGADR